jgi:nucleoside-diphosphate-sugar epimerase
MAEILITGGAGNFGRTLAQAFRAQGHGLRILDLPSCDFSFFDNWDNTRIIPGDILDPDSLKAHLEGVDWVFHLAAILPPVSETNRELTFKVNADGTKSLLDACSSLSDPPRVVFASSISVYGDTSGEEGVIGPDHPVNPNDWYAESKVEAEQILFSSGLPYVNLRISAIVIPAFLDPPEPWSFQSDQKIELVTLGDLVVAMTSLERLEKALNRTLIISGGKEWQMTGERYVNRWCEIMEIPADEMIYMDRPGWLNWYDSSESQDLLKYQNTTPEAFFKQLEAAVAEALA